jgi:ferric-dicitrate binding protein FerR (iron transport regulator)
VSRVPTQRTPPGQAGPEPVAPPPAPRRHRLRLALAIIGGALALLCLGGATVAYLAYDRYTAPDRSAPDVVVDNYLRAFLVDRDDVKAKLFTCEDGGQLADLAALRTDLEAREQRFSTTFTVKWGPLRVQRHGNSADVTVELVIATVVDTLAQTQREPWQFGTRREDGWGVCAARRPG